MREENWLTAIVFVLMASVVGVMGFLAYQEMTEPESGIVVSKDFSPAHTIISQSCISNGKTVTCTPVVIYQGDTWRVVYEDTSTHERGDRSVSQTEYDQIQVGQYFK